ncbi:unnamed protein product [Rotaria socialis]
MTLKQLEVDQNNKIIHNHEVDQSDFDINIRNQKVETVKFFTYLGCGVSRDQRPGDEINTRLAKASTAFNMLRSVIWYRKTISITSRLRIYRACVLPVLLYGSETWSITKTHEQRISTFYMKCLRIIIGVNLGDRISNDKILEITGQSQIETIIRRNRLRWFGHANRMMNSDNEPSVVKKITFSYFPEEKRPGNNGIRKRWEDKVKEDTEHCQIKNWRKYSLNRDHWRELINKNVQNRPVHQKIKEIIYEYKQRAVNRRNDGLAASHRVTKIKVTEILVKNTNNHYVCPGCGIQFKPQGITNHVSFVIITNFRHMLVHRKKWRISIIFELFDDDANNDNFLSCLNSTTVETIVVNLNNKNMTDTYSTQNKSNKRSLASSGNTKLNDSSQNGTVKKRKADLTCAICQGHAFGYNFDQISCESCKAFFRRNAFHEIEKTKCFNPNNILNGIRCIIRYDAKQKCQRCRLLKCFESGMRKDFILTPEQKRSKQQCLTENRRIRSMLTSSDANNIQDTKPEKSPSTYNKCDPAIDFSSSSSCYLTEADWSCLHYIQHAYLSSLQSSPSASSVISLELAPDKMSAYMNTLDIQNFAAVKLINFIRQIPEFEELDESDRLLLVKYNLILLFAIRHALTFDTTREVIYDDNINSSVSPAEEAFAHHCKSLYILCYGYEFNRLFTSILHTIVSLVDNDPVIAQLLMLNMIFLKGLSAIDDQESSLNDGQRVFHAHTKYTNLLFRYLIERTSFDTAVTKLMRIIELLIKIQRLTRDFHQYIKSKVDVNYVNPLMKSLLHLS